MRTIFGMILGCLLTAASVYVHDSMTAPADAVGTSASNSNMIVNWDVAEREWREVKENVHTAWLRLKANIG